MTQPAPMIRRPKPKIKSPPNAHPLAKQFFDLLDLEQVSMTDVAHRAGLNHGTVSKWKTHYTPTVDTLEAALNVLGYRLVIDRIPLRDRRHMRRGQRG